MPLILDVLIEFLIRLAINSFRKAGSRSWPVTTATVTRASMDKGHTGGSQMAVVTYRYVVADERFSGSYKEPFLIGGFGEDYLRRFPVGSDYPVRLNPSDPTKSVPVRG
jgi:hypothetical protein